MSDGALVYRVRSALESDIDQVLALERGTPELARWSRAHYQAMLGNDDGTVSQCLLVAEVGGSIVGFTAGRYVVGEDAAEVEALAVTAELRRQEVGMHLLCAFCDWAGSVCGAKGARLEVRKSNAGAIGFYQRMGFCFEGTRRAYYRDPAEDAVVLTKQFAQGRADSAL